MSAIERCRTAALGGHVARCQDCAYTTIAYNSCRNRHCPKCQGAAAKQWLAEREAELLPVPYFHLVFTLPARIAAIAYQNKAVVYDLLFRAAADTVLTIAADPKHLGARIGITAVLHTWGSTMTHHPHLHMIVPGGGISLDGSRWLSCRPGFFLPVPVFSKLFCGLMLAKLLAAHKAGQLKFFGQHASRTTNHRRQPSPSGSIPHDRDYWIATTPRRSRLLLVRNRLPSRSLNCAVRPSTQACNRHTQRPSQPSIPPAVACLSRHCSRPGAPRSFAHTFRLSQIPITEAAARRLRLSSPAGSFLAGFRTPATVTWLRRSWPASETLRNSCRKQMQQLHRYSITSSATASSPGGKLRPNALAVLRLITSSNLVDCMTGRSAGFSPLRIRPVYTPAWRSCDVACHLTLRLGVIHAMGDDTTLSPLH